MKFKQIVGFGDSWMWGDELLSPELTGLPNILPVSVENTKYRESHCFLGLLGQHYNVPTVNFGWPGGSLQSALWCYFWWLDHGLAQDETLILVGHTNATRQSFYNPNHQSRINDPPWNKFIHSTWVHSNNKGIGYEWIDMIKLHTMLTDCPELAILNYKQSVEFYHGQSLARKSPIIQFSVVKPPVVLKVPSLVTESSGLIDLLDTTSRAPGGHPNEIGHELVRDYLISHIDRVTIDE